MPTPEPSACYEMVLTLTCCVPSHIPPDVVEREALRHIASFPLLNHDLHVELEWHNKKETQK